VNASGFARLLLLSATWGASFLFMRIAVPVLGPVWLIFFRVLLAACFLWVVGKWLGRHLPIAGHWRHFLKLAFFSSALPFLLFAFAARDLTASLLSILNATAPIWAALISAVWFKLQTPAVKWVGMLLGLIGVGWLVGQGPVVVSGNTAWALAAGLAAPFCYGVASNYLRNAPKVGAFANAHGGMWGACIFLLPLAGSQPVPVDPVSMPVVLSVVLLGVLCSGVAYLIYFRLIDEFGPPSALTVTLLTPVFATLWGAWFLGEPMGWGTLIGGALVLLGTTVTTGFDPRSLMRRGLLPDQKP
jgi:drug/metabolite transporter (DMT)-like permease